MRKTFQILFLLFSGVLFAQDKIVTGTVLDESGIPLFGATVIVEGTSTGVVTDIDGNFSINIASNVNSIQVSYVGYLSQTVTIGNKSQLTVTLQPNLENLEEVIVVGYGTVKKSDLTGSVSSIKAKEVAQSGFVGIDQALAGRAPGVVVTNSTGEPGGAADIQIRGISSLNGSEPLYIIDGVQMDNALEESVGIGDLTSSSLSPLAMINQADIESIEILKDASSTAIYGSRGASGVILITTKQGKAGKGVINISQEFGITEVNRYIDVLDGNQYAIVNAEARLNIGTELTEAQDSLLTLGLAGSLRTNDWQRTVTSAGTQSNTNVSFSGGDKDMRYSVSGGLLQTTGPVLGSDFNRVTTRVRLDANVSKKLNIATNINYSRQNRETVGNTSFNRALRSNPLSGLDSNEEEDLINDEETVLTPRTAITNVINNTLQSQFVGSIDLKYNFTESLFFKSSFAYQERHTAQRYYRKALEDAGASGSSRTNDVRRTQITISNTLNFNKQMGKSNLNAVLGQEIIENESEGIRVQNFGYPNDLLTYYAPGIATFNDPDQVSYNKNVLASFFGRVNYTLNNKYLFTFTGRYDGSSKFAVNNKWSFFNAAAFAYKLSEENFLKDVDAISEIKLRASYGTAGNQAINPYNSLDLYEAEQTPFGEVASPIFYQTQLPNPNLSWETTSQADAGIDLGFFRNRFTATLDYYQKVTDDLLFTNQAAPAQSGFTTYTQNTGSLETKGFEASFNAEIIRGNKFSWALSGNVATGKTIVKGLTFDNTFSGWDPGYISGGTQRLIIGEEVGTFYGYKTAGIAQFDDLATFQGVDNQERIDLYSADPNAGHEFVDGYEGGLPFIDADSGADGVQANPGDQLYEDLNGDGVINDFDRQIIGQAQPEVTLGINNTFTIGNFDINIYMDSQIGKDVHNHSSIALLAFTGNQSEARAWNRWTPENPSNIYPRMNLNSNSGALRYSDRYIEDGSFVRLQNITCNYNFPKEITDKLSVSNLRVYLSGTNLAIWTKYKGLTPDTSSRRGNTSLGHDQTNYPPSRLIRLGVNVTF